MPTDIIFSIFQEYLLLSIIQYLIMHKKVLSIRARLAHNPPMPQKSRNGAFWEDRYHATAIQANEHLIRCIAYIDLNMVRARS